MNKIELKSCLPQVFSNVGVSSQLWNRDISFERGKSYLIKADSGRGKSSFCSYIMGYRSDYCGDIRFDNDEVKGYGAKEWSLMRQSHLSYLPQGLMLFDELTAVENITLKNNLTHYRTNDWIIAAMERFGLGERINFPVGKLSYGQKQRVAIIRALCQPFDFILLDEPVSHIDDTTAATIAIMLKEELIRTGAGMICTSIGKEIQFDYDKIIQL